MVTWWTVDDNGRGIPKWMRSVAIDKDGVAWAPALVAGGEAEVFFTAAWCGEPSMEDEDGHRFFRLDWLEQEFGNRPDAQKTIDSIRGRLRRGGAIPAG